MAQKAVGVGSVGTRCHLLVLRGPEDEPLLLRIKQAVQTVLESHGGRSQPALAPLGTADRAGHRVFSHQRVLQAVGDPFLRHFTGRSHDYSVRQYHDMKGAIRLADLAPEEFRACVRTCGALLARAHAQSAQATAIAAYLEDAPGHSGAGFDDAVGAWSAAYAAVADEDHARTAAAWVARTGAAGAVS